MGENAPFDADKPKQNRDYTHEEVVDGALLMEEIEWWMRKEGKERMSEEDKVALGWVFRKEKADSGRVGTLTKISD